MWSPELVAATVTEVSVETDGCPCDDESCGDEGDCCDTGSCACFATSAVVVAPRIGLDEPTFVDVEARWSLGPERRAKDRSLSPATRPPIG